MHSRCTNQTGTCPPYILTGTILDEVAQEKLNPGTKIFLILTPPLPHSGTIGEISYWAPKKSESPFCKHWITFTMQYSRVHNIHCIISSFKASPAQWQVAKPEGWIWKASCIHSAELLWSDAALLVFLATHYLNTTILEQWAHIQVSLHWSLKPDSEKANKLLSDPHAPDFTANSMCFVSSDACIEWAASSDWNTPESTVGIC